MACSARSYGLSCSARFYAAQDPVACGARSYGLQCKILWPRLVHCTLLTRPFDSPAGDCTSRLEPLGGLVGPAAGSAASTRACSAPCNAACTKRANVPAGPRLQEAARLGRKCMYRKRCTETKRVGDAWRQAFALPLDQSSRQSLYAWVMVSVEEQDGGTRGMGKGATEEGRGVSLPETRTLDATLSSACNAFSGTLSPPQARLNPRHFPPHASNAFPCMQRCLHMKRPITSCT